MILNFTLLNNCKLIILFGVVLIFNLLALCIRIENNNNFFVFIFIAVQLQLYIPNWADSICKKKMHH